MPIDGLHYDEYAEGRRLMPMRSAWFAHYVAKGCNERKAHELASKKTHTWPPK